jgi:cytoskeletal protein RodZ
MSRVVGNKLREARQAKNLTLEQVADATHIRLRYLEALESGRFNALPSQFQVKGFIRSYSSYLDMDAESLIEVLDLDPWTALDVLSEESQPADDTSEPPQVDSAASFENIGQILRNQRETLGLSLEDVARHTHLRIRYLEALEAGEIGALPSTVQGRGMLKNYAVFLGLDSDALLLHFADGLQARLVERAPKQEASAVRPRPTLPRRERRFLSRDLIIGIVLALALVAFIVWGTIQVTALRAAEDVEPTAPSIADVLLPSPTLTQIPTMTPTLPPQDEGETVGGRVVENPVVEATQEVIFVSESLDGAVQVQIVARQRAWMRITVDGEVEFDGRTIPGNIYGFAGEEYVEITTGNGAGLQVFYNDLDLGTLGSFGEVINFVITVNGVQTPTPTITLTASPIPTQTSTPTATPTP